MTQPVPISATAQRPTAALPPYELRTLISFLLFVHLFTVGVGILASGGRSALTVRLAELKGFRQYRQALCMELPYSFYFTRGNDFGGEVDIDYRLNATVKHADGQDETIELPTSDMRPHQRFHRYQVLARNLATFASEDQGNPQSLDLLAAALAAGLLKQNDAVRLDLRCRGQLTPPAMDQFRPDDPTNWTRTRDAYEAHAFVSGDRVEVLKKDPPRDTAPPPKDK